MRKTKAPVIREINEGQDFGLLKCYHCGTRSVDPDQMVCTFCGARVLD